MTATQEKKRKKYRYTARTADRHKLYQLAVQCPEADVDFLDEVFKESNKRPPMSLTEDFCGTSLLCAEWVKSKPGRTAIGIDIDEEVLAWGENHNIRPLGNTAEQVTLIQSSVIDVAQPLVDIRVAFNFSYSLFLDRPTLLKYFKVARSSLNPGGLFVIDLHGGPEAQDATKETKRLAGFKYIWEQGELNAINQRMDCYIHFEFPDRSRMHRAFTYHWRLWGMMELRDILTDAGFSSSAVYWEGTEPDTDEGDGIFVKCDEAENDPSWIAYIVAEV